MDELIALIKAELGLQIAVGPHTPLFSSGLIDSFQLARIMSALESHYGVHLERADLGADNFDTPEQMHSLISSRQ